MGVTVKRPVYVKVVVTDEFKARRSEEIRAAVSRIDAVVQRIDFRLNAGMRQPGGEAVAERLRAEIRRNEQAKAALAQELEKLSSCDIGAEYDRGVLEGLVEIDVGDDIGKLSACEIVVKDDKVVEIRDGICPEVEKISL